MLLTYNTAIPVLGSCCLPEILRGAAAAKCSRCADSSTKQHRWSLDIVSLCSCSLCSRKGLG